MQQKQQQHSRPDSLDYLRTENCRKIILRAPLTISTRRNAEARTVTADTSTMHLIHSSIYSSTENIKGRTSHQQTNKFLLASDN